MGFSRLPKGPRPGADTASPEEGGLDRMLQMMRMHKIHRKAQDGEEAAGEEKEEEAGEEEAGEEKAGEEKVGEEEAIAEEAAEEEGGEGESSEEEGADEDIAPSGGPAPASEEAVAKEEEGEEEAPPIQMKRDVAEPGDGAEVEADQVADAVASGGEVPKISQAPTPVSRKADESAWPKPQLEDIQRELKRLGLYTMTVDGKMGNGTRGALTKAFSGEAWSTMAGDAVLGQLKSMKTAGAKGAPDGWSEAHIKQMQQELQRLGLYNKGLDGKWGKGTKGALVEAFGGDEWKSLDPESALARLKAAKPPSGKKGERNLRYGEMFKDNVLDMTLGVGFDEGGAHEDAIKNFTEVLGSNNFVDDRGKAQKIYAQAGRELGPSAFGKFFVRENALTYKPPAGPARQIHAVIRLVSNPDGSKGKEAAGAFKEGMAESDVSYYSGHGRYGSGPDFDRNFGEFKLLDEAGEVEEQITDYEALEAKLKDEGKKSKRGPWEQFMWRLEHKRMDVNLSNDGNVFMNAKNQHLGEFGAKLIYWALQQKGGPEPVMGEGGEMDKKQKEKGNESRDYKLMVFDGCRTQDYMTQVRSTPGLDAQGADVLNTKRTLNWGDEAKTLAVFIESILGQQSADKIVKDMDAQQSSSEGSGVGHAYQASGLEDNPVFK